VHREGADAATTTHLADTLRALPLPDDGDGQAWGAAESTVARTLREILRDERGMERKLVSAKGYWLRSGEWPDDDED
jgi:NADPH-dependent ferric siderophore reductase